MNQRYQRAWLGLVLVGLGFGPLASTAQQLSSRDIVHPVYGQNGMVVTQHADATRIGVEILRRGGNAVDAAVAVGFALAVCLPRAGNLGGGGFMLIHLASGQTLALDYRETAPQAASRDMFKAGDGVDFERSQYSYLAAAVPGTVAGLTSALERYGTLSLAEVIAPAIELARQGVVVTPDLWTDLQAHRAVLARWPQSLRIFFKPDGSGYALGERLVQEDLAWSLEQIARQGKDAFYRGAIAQKIVAAMAAGGGLIREQDLLDYHPAWRQPVRGSYRGFQVASMPPPSSGGVHLIQLLNILEGFPLSFLGANSAESLHLMTEAMKLAYADRSEYLGDPDFFRVPVAGLTSKVYAQDLRRQIDRYRARPALEIKAGNPPPAESPDTTHFSVMDRQGNAVANTYTLNFSYGSGIVVNGTGILLNNEMDDFSAKPGVPNSYGLIGGAANAIAPGKRPLSSMTPTILFNSDGQPYLVTGSPGGSRIITTTLQIILNVVDHGMNVAAATVAPRIHHQWLPDVLRVEEGLSADTLNLLTLKGHRISVEDSMGSTQSILKTPAGYFGAADPRRPDALALGY